MDLLAQLLTAQTNYPPDHDFWYEPVASGRPTLAGVRVDEHAAQNLSAWFRGKDILSTSLAMLPLQVFERTEQGSELARGNPLYDVLHTKPNGWQDSFQWRRQAGRHLIDHGNAYSYIIEGARGFADQLQPIDDPRTVTPEKIAGGRVIYRVRDPKTGSTKTYTQDEIFHLRGVSEDGVTGMGVLAFARQSLGTAMATEAYAAQIFGRGTVNGGIVKVPTRLDEEASKRMARSFVTAASEWALPKVLEQGADWTPNTITPEDFQMLASRKFSVDDIARWLGLPPHMLGSLDRATFSNIEHQGQEFVTYSLGPWLSLWEFACNDQLILNPRRFYVEFTRDALVRGDIAVRWRAHVEAVNAGIKTVDEVRTVENLNRRGGEADELRIPQNITGKPDASGEAQAPPKQTPPPPTDEDDDAEQARAIVVSAAARVLRKEIKAMQKLGVQFAHDGDRFAEAVAAFYAKHVELLVDSLLMPTAAAETYCANQARQVVTFGVAVVESWASETYAKGLAAWALDKEAA